MALYLDTIHSKLYHTNLFPAKMKKISIIINQSIISGLGRGYFGVIIYLFSAVDLDSDAIDGLYLPSVQEQNKEIKINPVSVL